MAKRPPPCTFYARGECRKGAACIFEHIEIEVKSVAVSSTFVSCVHYQSGFCRAGDACQFAHDTCDGATSDSAVRKTCGFFLKGSCTKGAGCTFRHPEEEESAALGILSRFGWPGHKINPGEIRRHISRLVFPSRNTPQADERHPSPRDRICTFYQQGRCTKGASCKFLHEKLPEDVPSTAPVTAADHGKGEKKTDPAELERLLLDMQESDRVRLPRDLCATILLRADAVLFQYVFIKLELSPQVLYTHYLTC